MLISNEAQSLARQLVRPAAYRGSGDTKRTGYRRLAAVPINEERELHGGASAMNAASVRTSVQQCKGAKVRQFVRTKYDNGYMTSLSERMRAAAKHAGKTQADIARHLKLRNRSTVNAWFGPRAVTLSANYAVEVARFLGVDPVWLATGKGEMVQADDRALELYSAEVRRLENSQDAERLLPIIGQALQIVRVLQATGGDPDAPE